MKTFFLLDLPLLDDILPKRSLITKHCSKFLCLEQSDGAIRVAGNYFFETASQVAFLANANHIN